MAKAKGASAQKPTETEEAPAVEAEVVAVEEEPAEAPVKNVTATQTATTIRPSEATVPKMERATVQLYGGSSPTSFVSNTVEMNMAEGWVKALDEKGRQVVHYGHFTITEIKG